MTASPPWIKDSLPQKDSTQPGVKDLYKTTDVKADSQFIVLDDAPAGGGGGQGADVAAINADDEFADLETDPGVVAAYQDAQVAAGVWTQDDVDAARAEGANPSSPPKTSNRSKPFTTRFGAARKPSAAPTTPSAFSLRPVPPKPR